jgi:hypothetical protein
MNYAHKLDDEVGLIRDLILQGTGTKRSIAEADGEPALRHAVS